MMLFIKKREYSNYSALTESPPWSPIEIHLGTNQSISYNDTKIIFISVAHASPSRLDVYSNGEHVPALNLVKSQHGVLFLNSSHQMNSRTPKLQNGDNILVMKKNQLTLEVSLSNGLQIRPVPIVTTSLKLKLLNAEKSQEEIGSDLVKSITDNLGYSLSKNNIMVTESCISACRNSLSLSAFYIKISLGDIPLEKYMSEEFLTSEMEILSNLSLIARDLVNLVQSLKLENDTDISINKIMMPSYWLVDHEQNSSLCHKTRIKRAANLKDVSFQTPRKLKLCPKMENILEGMVFTVQPRVKLVDTNGDVIKNVAPSQNGKDSWFVEVSLEPSNFENFLVGNRSEPIVNGVAQFKDLAINTTGIGFTLNYKVSVLRGLQNLEVTNLSAWSNTFTVNEVPLKLEITNLPYNAKEGETFAPSPRVKIVQSNTNKSPSSEFLSKYAWLANVYLLDEDYYNGSQLTGTTMKTFDKGSESVYFNNISLTRFGYQFRLGVSVKSEPAKYNLKGMMSPFDVERDVQFPRVVEAVWTIQIVFNNSFGLVAPYKDSFLIYFLNFYGNKYNRVKWSDAFIRPGSVITNASISGTTENLQQTVSSIQSEVSTPNFNGSTLTVIGVTMTESSDTSNSNLTNPSFNIATGTTVPDNGLPVAWVVAIVLNVVLAVVFVLAIIYWCKKHKRSSGRIYDSSTTKLFEKTISEDPNLENKAAAGGKNEVYSIHFDDDHHRDTSSRNSSRFSRDRIDKISLPHTNSGEDGRGNSRLSGRTHSRNSRRNSGDSRTSSGDRSRRNSLLSIYSRSRSNSDLRSSSALDSYDRSRSSGRRRSSLPSDPQDAFYGNYTSYDETEEDDNNREKYLVYEISWPSDTSKNRDYISYLMLPMEDPPTLHRTRDYIGRSPTNSLQQISNLNYIFTRESGKQIAKPLEENVKVSDIFPNREIHIQVITAKRLRGFLRNNIVHKTVRQIHSNGIGIQCQKQDCEKEAKLKCLQCGKAPYCSKKCLMEDLRFHSAVCFKPPWNP